MRVRAHAGMPRDIGSYRVLGAIARGGMALLYKAVRRGLAGFERPVVIKVLDPKNAANPAMIDLFKLEARVLAMLAHPHIVQVHDFGVHEGMLYLVMEDLDGRDLLQIMRAATGPLPVGVALRIARELADGLAYLHAFQHPRGGAFQIVHRDVSPANVMVSADGTVKLLDFGVAKILADCELDDTQNMRGKFSYMAPEQLRGEPFDRRVDVFAAGILLHEMLTGRRLFYRPHVEDTLQAIEAGPIPSPSETNRKIPEALDRVVMRALERDPAARWRSAVEMAEALHAIRGFDLSRRAFVELLAQASPEEEHTLETDGLCPAGRGRRPL